MSLSSTYIRLTAENVEAVETLLPHTKDELWTAHLPLDDVKVKLELVPDVV